MKKFDKNNLIVAKVDENDLMSFLVKMDIDDSGNPMFPLEDLSKEIVNVIPEYVFADHIDHSIPLTDVMERLREAASAIYKIRDYDVVYKAVVQNDATAQAELDKSAYLKRGEFGELLLHMILRDFKNTVPLISKVFFKDSANVPAHGFDAVHVSPNDSILWLGESKLYNDGKLGVRALAEDLAHHLRTDYLNEQFAIIMKNLNNDSIPQRKEWIKKLSSASRLADKLSFINIPMLCVYEHDIYSKFADTMRQDAADYHEINVRELKSYFDACNRNPLSDKCNIILMLLPIKNKKELVKALHLKLFAMQNI